MSDATFPARTAGEVTLPNGDVVFVCTLNTMLREEANDKARWYAMTECRPLRKGESQYAELLAQVKGMTAEEQSQFLAQQENYRMRRDAEDRYPLPEKPEQGESTPEEFTQAAVKWEADCKQAEEQREKRYAELYEAELAKHKALKAQKRIEACCVAYHAQEAAKVFMQRVGIESLYRAVRLADDHTIRYFKSAAAFEDAPDDVQQVLSDFYHGRLETVKPDDIPTSPAGS